MGVFDGLDISGSGLTAHRKWMETAAMNIANANTTRTPAGGPYRRKAVVFAEALRAAGTSDPLGVKVASVANDPAPFPRVFNPAHPDANAQGFLAMPNVNPVQEMADLTVASRAYEANAAAFGVAKSMFVKALEIGR